MGCGASSLRAQGHEKYKDEAAPKSSLHTFMHARVDIWYQATQLKREPIERIRKMHRLLFRDTRRERLEEPCFPIGCDFGRFRYRQKERIDDNSAVSRAINAAGSVTQKHASSCCSPYGSQS